jgi:hypothetical protein
VGKQLTDGSVATRSFKYLSLLYVATTYRVSSSRLNGVETRDGKVALRRRAK